MVDAALDILPLSTCRTSISSYNPLAPNTPREVAAYANAHGAWRVTDEDHTFMMDQTNRRGLFDFVERFDDSYDDDEGEDEEEDNDNLEEEDNKEKNEEENDSEEDDDLEH